MEAAWLILIIPVVVIIAICATCWHYSRSNEVLTQWAEQNGYRLLSQEYRHFAKGPFFWTSSKDQTVYYVTVEDRDGQVKRGWVRCGGYWTGLMSDRAEVRWE
jgi:hypothetical protein